MGRDFRLPPLRGEILTGYRILMLVLLLIALPGFLSAYEQQRDAQASVRPGFAAGLRFPGGNDSVIRVAPFSAEARAEGVLPGDRLVAIDGRAFPDFDFNALQTALAGPDGSPYRLTVQTDDHAPRTIPLTRSSHYIEEAYAGSGLTFARRSWTIFGFNLIDMALAMATALLLFVRRSTDPVAAMLALSAVPLAGGLAYLWPGGSYAQYCFSVLRAMLFLTGLLVFPNGRFVPGWTVFALPLVPVIGIVSMQAVTFETAIGLRQLLLFGFVLLAIGALVLRYRATPPGLPRQQIKFVMLGGVAWAALGLLGAALQRGSDISVSVPGAAWLSLGAHLAGSLAAIALEAGILVSLLRYRLYDADALIGRSAVYAFLTLLLGAVFAGSEKVVQVTGEQFFGQSARAVSAGFGAAIAATLVAPLHKRVHDWAERRFQRLLVALKHDLPKSIGDLREVATLDRLLAGVLKRMARGVRATHAAVILGSGEAIDVLRAANITEGDVRAWRENWQPPRGTGLDCDRGDPRFPLRLPLRLDNGSPIGWVLLGPRPDGSFYGKDEREALAEVADPIARAIRIVRERDARAAQQRAETEALKERVAQLEKHLATLASTPA